MARSHPSRRGFTLLELILVLVIIASVATLVIGVLDSFPEQAELTVARANLSTVREAILGSATAPGYLADMKYVPGFQKEGLRIHDLLSPSSYPNDLFDPVLNRGWRGPYVQRTPGIRYPDPDHPQRFPMDVEVRFLGDATFFQRGFVKSDGTSWYGIPHNHDTLNHQEGDLVIGDPWGNPVVLQIPPDDAFSSPTDTKRWRYARLVSAGPDGVLSTPYYDLTVTNPSTRMTEARLAGRRDSNTVTARGDDLVLFLNRIDVYEDEEP